MTSDCLHLRPDTMSRFIRGDFRFMLQRESDVVQPVQQAVPGEFIHGEGCRKAAPILHALRFKINGELVALNFLGAMHDLRNLLVGKTHGQQAILRLLLAKMSANDEAITTRKPKSASAHTACSREDPQPKFFPATRIDAPW